MKILAILGGGLGYRAWLQVDSMGVNDCMLMPCGRLLGRCHPVIRASEKHARTIGGVSVGDLICGVRWTEPYTDQPYINEV